VHIKVDMLRQYPKQGKGAENGTDPIKLPS